MKPLTLLPLALVLSPLHAATIIDSATLNGSFENGSGSGAGSTITGWTTTTDAGATLQRINNNASVGSYSAVIGRADVTGNPTNLSINTGYTIASNDAFRLTFDSKGALYAEASDQISWSLYYTSDDQPTGTIITLFSGFKTLTGATGDATTSPFSAFDFTSANVDPSAIGKKLYLSFTPGTGFTANEFSRIDNVVLTTVPEPGAPSLIALAFSTAFLMRKRRI